ncbi:MAG: hypothetical protein M5U35_17005 [Roseovarius sp.]|nr:hypothetical protein [Roseovarius sp.]
MGVIAGDKRAAAPSSPPGLSYLDPTRAHRAGTAASDPVGAAAHDQHGAAQFAPAQRHVAEQYRADQRQIAPEEADRPRAGPDQMGGDARRKHEQRQRQGDHVQRHPCHVGGCERKEQGHAGKFGHRRRQHRAQERRRIDPRDQSDRDGHEIRPDHDADQVEPGMVKPAIVVHRQGVSQGVREIKRVRTCLGRVVGQKYVETAT